MAKQLTKSDKFAMLLEALQSAEVQNKEVLVDFVSAEKALVEKRNATRSASRKPTKAQKENEALVTQVVEFFTGDEVVSDQRYTADEVAEAVGFEDFSAQKMTALMKKAVEEGVVTKTDQATSNKKKVGYAKMPQVADAEVEGDSLPESLQLDSSL